MAVKNRFGTGGGRTARVMGGAVFAVLAAALPAAALAQAAATDETLQRNIALSERLGQALFDRDTAAYVSSGDLQAHFTGGLDWVKGWLTLKEGEEYKVLFIGDSEAGPKAYYVAFVRDDAVFDRFIPPSGMPLSNTERAAWRARQDALDRDTMKCAERYNTVVIPYSGAGDAPGGQFVYLMPASSESRTVKAGGFQLFDYSSDGETLKGEMPFSQNCFDVEKDAADGDGNIILTHSMTPYPQEHHVFMSLLYGAPIYVATQQNHVIWKVADGKIAFFREDRPE